MLVASVGIYSKPLPTFNLTTWNTSSKIPFIKSWLITTNSLGWFIEAKCGMRSHIPYLLITSIIIEDVLNTLAHICTICSLLHALMLGYSEYFGRVCTHHPSGCKPSFPVSDAHSDTHPSHTPRTDARLF